MEGYGFKPIRVAISCLVCGEEIEIGINDPKIQICKECKAVIMAMRYSQQNKEEHNNA